MKGLKLAMISRGYWPMIGGAEVIMGRLAAAFHARGAEVNVLTAQWSTSWPLSINQQGVRVTRIPQSEKRFLGTWSYMRGIRRWLREQRKHYDLVYVSMLKHDAYVAVGEGLLESFPVVLRAEGAGATGDCQWQREATCGGRIKKRCENASLLIAPSQAVEQEMLAAGYPRERTRLIPNGVTVGAPRGKELKQQARRALGECQGALRVSQEALVVLYTGRLHPMKGLEHLIQGWRGVLEEFPQARLWIVGDGPSGPELRKLVNDLALNGEIVFAGSFDDVQDFLYAADLFVLPSLQEGLSLSLLEAMSVGLPVVVSDIPANRAIIIDGTNGLVVPTAQGEPLAGAIKRIFGDPQLGSRLGDAARQLVTREYSFDGVVVRHEALFREVLASR